MRTTLPTQDPGNTRQPTAEPAAPELSLQTLGIQLQANDSHELWAEFHPPKTSQPLTLEQLAKLVIQAGYTATDYPLVAADAAVFLDAVRRRQPYMGRISAPVDARVEVFVSPNRLTAGLVLHGAQGQGRAISLDDLHQALKKTKVTHGLIDAALAEITHPELDQQLRNTNQVYCSLVAYGQNFTNGTDAWLEFLVKDASDRRPLEDEFGRIHYLEKGSFPYVEEGTALLRRYPPTKGVPGVNVNGKTLRAKDGKDIQLRLKDASVAPAAEDPDLLLAAKSGMPVIYDRGAQIEETLKVDTVDLSTGHVRYRGSIEVKGDVRDGMQVTATGDIKIHGGVDTAFVKAGGHIEVIGGAIGHKNASSLSRKAVLKAGCSIKVRFAHEAHLEAEHEILIGNQVMHSILKAGSFIKIEGKGQVVGGQLQAVDTIEANTTGAVAYSETKFVIGACPELQASYTQLLAQLNLIDDKKYRLIEIARKVRKKGKDEILKCKDQLLAAKAKIQAEAKELNLALAQTEAELKRYYAAKLIVHRRAYPGTWVSLAGAELEVSRELDKVTFYLHDGKVHTRQ